jgi:opacity protein-like surface antigen
MKQALVCVMCLLVTSGLSFGQGLAVGAHGAYSIGGDVETPSFGYGAQVGVNVNDFLSLELSATLFSDEPESGTIDGGDEDDVEGLDFDVDITHIALTARGGFELMPNLRLYGGGGVSYNMFDVNSPGLDALLAELDDDAMLQAFLAAGGRVTGGLDFDVENSIGYHAAVGVSYAINELVELFAEYRFTWLDVEMEASANIKATLADGTVIFDESFAEKMDDASYDFGLARVGVNILL